MMEMCAKLLQKALRILVPEKKKKIVLFAWIKCIN